MPRYPDFEITTHHPLGNQARSTKVRELSTGLEVAFMSDLTKGEAVHQFNKYFGRI